MDLHFTSCEVDLDECESHPCQNGGTCSQSLLPGNYTCECPSEFEGRNCQDVKVRTCAHLPCLNGGTCRNVESRRDGSDDRYLCDCNTGFRGTDCEIKKDFCQEFSRPCKNGATCISDDLAYVRSAVFELPLCSIKIILFVRLES